MIKYMILGILVFTMFGCVDNKHDNIPHVPTTAGMQYNVIRNIDVMAVDDNLTVIRDITFRGYNPFELGSDYYPYSKDMLTGAYTFRVTTYFEAYASNVPDEYDRIYTTIRDDPDVKVYQFHLKELRNFSLYLEYNNITYSCFDTRDGKFILQENEYTLPSCLFVQNSKVYGLQQFSKYLECGYGDLRSDSVYEKDLIQNNTLYNLKCIQVNDTVYKSVNFTYSTRKW